MHGRPPLTKKKKKKQIQTKINHIVSIAMGELEKEVTITLAGFVAFFSNGT